MTQTKDRELVLRKHCHKKVEPCGKVSYGQTWKESQQGLRHGKVSEHKGGVDRHWGRPVGTGPHRCEECGKSFAQSWVWLTSKSSHWRKTMSVMSVGKPSVGVGLFNQRNPQYSETVPL